MVMRFLARISLTHFGARPRPVHFSEPLGFLNLAATVARLSPTLPFLFAGFAFTALALALTDLAGRPRFFRPPKSSSDKSLVDSRYFFSTANIATVADLRLARRFSSSDIFRAVAANCLSVSFLRLFIG